MIASIIILYLVGSCMADASATLRCSVAPGCQISNCDDAWSGEFPITCKAGDASQSENTGNGLLSSITENALGTRVTNFEKGLKNLEAKFDQVFQSMEATEPQQEEDIAKALKQSTEAREEIQELETEVVLIKIVQQDLAAFRQKFETTMNDVDTFEEEQEDEIDDVRKQVVKILEKMGSLESGLKDLELKFDKKMEEIEEFENSQENEINTAGKDNEDLKKRLEYLEEKFETKMNNIDTFEDSQEADIDNVRKVNVGLKRRLDILEAKFETSMQNIDTFEDDQSNDIDNVRKENAELKKRLESLEEKFTTTMKNIDVFEDGQAGDIENVQKENAQLRKDLNALVKRVSEFFKA